MHESAPGPGGHGDSTEGCPQPQVGTRTYISLDRVSLLLTESLNLGDKLKFGGLQDRHVAEFRAFEGAAGINADLMKGIYVPMTFFPEFRRQTIQTSGTTINVLVGGDGPPVLLLHGYPQTHVQWRKIAPRLAKNYTLVIADLRGYGDSGKPPDGDNHINYSKRAMALDQVEVMEKLGFRQFAIVSHDRGARVGHRLALDHPDKLTKLVIMDICPTLYMYATADRHFANAYFHWFFLTQPTPFPETLIGNNVDAVLKFIMGQAMPEFIEPDAYAEYRRCFRDPATIHASCEDYRAAASMTSSTMKPT